ncbi:MAG TPA: tRNA preQ1(34) S-adenosylmethionine ribosyltransferase-isomerase QueA [Clostridiaceae bacterium]|jgi:S-adenosylmethionine:tRNA ribosyltransferase-isomerase|nr:tRNA preQ1(34) S-adenosylmethionine ribosyltransferase-isomerase QueA [Clostridiaceae bacterium]
MKVTDFDYYLPEELIAQEPSKERQMSRLLVLDRTTGVIEHRIFRDITDYLDKGDCLVLNDTRVMPARLLGTREGTGGRIEFVLLNRIREDVWEVILKPGRRAKPGARFQFGNGLLKAEILEVAEEGNRIVRFEHQGVFEDVLNQVGIIPLPPYIKKGIDDPERYQTVYSRNTGSAAAPTAGLHFTEELLKTITDKGVDLAYITLHVGLGTFRPVKVENLEEHKMHSEYFRIDEKACRTINLAKERGNRVISVGTTSCRALETAGAREGYVKPFEGRTDIFIYPGYNFKVVDALITNFHLPQSTLLMLVSALAGREKILNAYQEAIKFRYRFFSFGDAMFIK